MQKNILQDNHTFLSQPPANTYGKNVTLNSSATVPWYSFVYNFWELSAVHYLNSYLYNNFETKPHGNPLGAQEQKCVTLAGKVSTGHIHSPMICQIERIHSYNQSYQNWSSIVWTGGGVTLGAEEELLPVLSRISLYSWHMAHKWQNKCVVKSPQGASYTRQIIWSEQYLISLKDIKHHCTERKT